MTDSTLPGVNLSGLLKAALGLGEAARGYMSALRQLDIPLALNDFSSQARQPKISNPPWSTQDSNPFAVNLICLNAPEFVQWIAKQRPEYLEGHYNIGTWWWELPSLPPDWYEAFHHLDEIWVGSSFVHENIKRVSPIPVTVIPPVVSLDQAPDLTRADFGLPQEEFLFLFAFDLFSDLERKNPLALIRAFKEAFSPNEPVRLVLKCGNAEHFPNQFQKIRMELSNARITVVDRYLSRREMSGLIASCDCYCSLHRAEGFGLPIAEAMLLGKPAIATAWSGNMDFMTEENSYPVSYKLTRTASGLDQYPQGDIWAEPSISDAALWMRRVYEQPDEAARKGREGARLLRADFSMNAVSICMARELDRIAKQSIPEKSAASNTWIAASLLVDSHIDRAVLHENANLYESSRRIGDTAPDESLRSTASSIRRRILSLPTRVAKRALTPVIDAQTRYNVANTKLTDTQGEELQSLRRSHELLKRLLLAGQRAMSTQVSELSNRMSALEGVANNGHRLAFEESDGIRCQSDQHESPAQSPGKQTRSAQTTSPGEPAKTHKLKSAWPAAHGKPPEELSAPELQAAIGSLPWWHSMDFGNGLLSNGTKSLDLLKQESQIAFEFSVSDKTVLDVGAWDGFFSFEAKRLGASRVLATDHFCWGGPGWGSKQSFLLARRLLSPDVDDLDIDPMNIDVETVGEFDVVLFLGVLYHLRHPLYVLERLSTVCRELLVLETHLDLDDLQKPAMAFYPGDELAGDPTNWCGPNKQCVTAMLKLVGFTRVEFSAHPTSPARGFFHAFKS